ncbi:NAD-glutamate dehydrogenase [Kocuria rhizophila]|nr:NAD-glutamate dehydrogenase [Kocuria rhizophila]
MGAQMGQERRDRAHGREGRVLPEQLPDPATDREGWLTEGREAYDSSSHPCFNITDNIVREAETGAGQESPAKTGRAGDRAGCGVVRPAGTPLQVPRPVRAVPPRPPARPGDNRGAPQERHTRRRRLPTWWSLLTGTAAFSDTANAISLDRGFWLGDAFASGGSWATTTRPWASPPRCVGVP